MASPPPKIAARPTVDAMRRAAKGLEGIIVHTPLVPYRHADGTPTRILLKPEILQPVTSFKLRGLFHAVASLSPLERAQGVSTVSAGNTAQALAWAARHFGVAARSVMPETAPSTKIEAVRALGGTPVLVPTPEVFAYLKEHRWQSEPFAFIHPWTNSDVLTGHASLGLEIAQDCPEVATVFLPVGGGGLLAGTASALRALCPAVRIVAVEPEGCPALATALERGQPVEVACHTCCDGIAVPYITEEMFPLLQELVDEVVLVSDDTTLESVRELLERYKVVVEPSGAIGLAAARSRPTKGHTVCVLSGGSLDRRLLRDVVG